MLLFINLYYRPGLSLLLCRLENLIKEMVPCSLCCVLTKISLLRSAHNYQYPIPHPIYLISLLYLFHLPFSLSYNQELFEASPFEYF